MGIDTFDFGVAPYVDESKRIEITVPYPSVLAGVNYTKNPDLWSYYPSFSVWSGKVMNGETHEPEVVDKLHRSFQMGLHSSAGIPKDPIPIDNGHASYKDVKQEAYGYVIDSAVVNGNEIVDIVNGQEAIRNCPEGTRVLMLKIAWLPSGFQAVASGSAPSISISLDNFENGNVILRQPGLVIRPADNWIPKLAAFEEKGAKVETKKFMDANSPVMQAWVELLAGLDEAVGQELFDKVKELMAGTPDTPPAETAPEMNSIAPALTKEEVQAMITTAISGLTTQPVATLPTPTEGMLTARFEAVGLPFEISEKLEEKCKDFTAEQAKTYVMSFKASHNPPKAGHDLPEIDEDINKVPASIMEWK